MPAIVRACRLKPVALLVAAGITVAASSLVSRSADDKLGYEPVAYAIKGAKVFVAPGRTIDVGTVVVRKGVIEAVGPADSVKIPYDAEVIEGKGLVVYPGFLDLYTTLGQPVGVTRSQVGAGRTIKYADNAWPKTPTDNRLGMTPEFEVANVLDLPDATADERRRLGFTDIVAAPAGAIATGQSAVVSTSGLPRREAIVRSPLALHVHLATPNEPTPPPDPNEPPAVATRRFRATGATGYPMALMGVVAHLRQAMLDAEHAHVLDQFYEEKGGPRPPSDAALRALYAAGTKARTRLVGGEHARRDPPVARPGRRVRHDGRDRRRSRGGEGRRRAQGEGRPGRPQARLPRRAEGPDRGRISEATRRRARGAAPRPGRPQREVEGAGRHRRRGSPGPASRSPSRTDGIAKAETVPAQVRKAIAQGLSKDDALDALTRTAAKIAGLDKRLGTIEVGKLGHIVVMTAPFEDEKSKVRYMLADGIKFDMEKQPAAKKDATGKGGVGKGRGGAARQGDRPRRRDRRRARRPREGRVEGRVAGRPSRSPRGRRTPRRSPTRPGRTRPRRRKSRPSRSSTSPPSSRPTASRRSGPAATSSSRTP